MDETNRNEVRAAAFLAAQARMDFVGPGRSRTGKTRKQVKCLPPNKQCGNRCIPPEWDCRIKGEGSDAHLKAVKTDPLGGAANIQRGINRIRKGVPQGNFSDVEGGIRSINRGVVKITPGNIQQKKERQARLQKATAPLAIGLALVTGGVLAHSRMKATWPRYANNWGRSLDDAVRDGFNHIQDNAPFIGGRRREIRAQARAVALNTTAQLRQRATQDPRALVGRLSEGQIGPRTTALIQTPTVGAKDNVREALNRVDLAYRGNPDQAAWKQASQEAYFGARRPGSSSPGSAFSEPATQSLLARQYGFVGELRGPLTHRKQILERHIATQMRQHSEILVTDAKNLGLDFTAKGLSPNTRESIKNEYVRFVTRRQFPEIARMDPSIRQSIEGNLRQLLPNSGDGNFSPHARRAYRQTLNGFDEFYAEVESMVRRAPGASVDAEARNTVYLAEQSYNRYLSRRLTYAHKGQGVKGPLHGELIQAHYFNTKVNPTTAYSVSDRVMLGAATELEGRPITSKSEAHRLLMTRHRFSNLQGNLEANQRTLPAITDSPPRKGRPGRTKEQRLAAYIAALEKAGYSPEAAQRKGAAEAMKWDSEDTGLSPRVRTYLRTLAGTR